MDEVHALPVVVLDHGDRRIAEALVGLQQISYRVEAEFIGDDAIPPLHESIDAVAALDLTFLAIIERGSGPVAALGFRVADGVLDIDRLAVHPRRFREGLGRRLVDAVLEQVPHERAVVSTGRANHPARRLYERAGFVHREDLAATSTLIVSRYVRLAAGLPATTLDAASDRSQWRPVRRAGRCRAVAVTGRIPVMPTPSCNPSCGEVPPAVLAAFGIDASGESRTLGDVHLYPGVVLKPVTHAAEAQWCADVLETLELAELRVPRPLRTATGAAVVRGWCGWERLAGQAAPERWVDVLAVAGRLHRGLADRSRPGWMDTKDDLWRQADRYAWDEAALPLDGRVHRLHPLLEQLETLGVSKRRPSRAQVVHIDLLGNVLFAEPLAPAVIDPTFYWRPAGYAEAVVAVDAAAWSTAGTAPLEHLAARGGLHLLIRAARFRVARDVLSPDASAEQVAAHTKVAAWLLEHDDRPPARH